MSEWISVEIPEALIVRCGSFIEAMRESGVPVNGYTWATLLDGYEYRINIEADRKIVKYRPIQNKEGVNFCEKGNEESR